LDFASQFSWWLSKLTYQKGISVVAMFFVMPFLNGKEFYWPWSVVKSAFIGGANSMSEDGW